jgi:hypothetical protein
MPRAQVIYVGNFSMPYSTETHLARDLEKLDCIVRRIDQAFAVADWDAFRDEVFQHGRTADLCIYTKTQALPRDEAIRLWRDLERTGCRTASFHLDLYRGLNREHEVGVDPMWLTERVFTADGGSDAWFASKGVEHRWLSPAVVSDETDIGVFDPTLAHDVVFVGKVAGYHEQWPWRRELVQTLKRSFGGRCRIWGHGDRPVMRGQRLNDLCASAKVIVGDSLMLPGHTRYWSDRYFETIGRGGFLVAPHVPGLDDFLTAGTHYLSYEPGDTKSLLRTVRLALEDVAGRRSIQRTGHLHVASKHTYADRGAIILQEFDL